VTAQLAIRKRLNKPPSMTRAEALRHALAFALRKVHIGRKRLKLDEDTRRQLAGERPPSFIDDYLSPRDRPSPTSASQLRDEIAFPLRSGPRPPNVQHPALFAGTLQQRLADPLLTSHTGNGRQ
jgi:hypothetical protein